MRHRGARGTYFAARVLHIEMERGVGLDSEAETVPLAHMHAYASGVNLLTLFCR
jgi:hypothetical protein